MKTLTTQATHTFLRPILVAFILLFGTTASSGEEIEITMRLLEPADGGGFTNLPNGFVFRIFVDTEAQDMSPIEDFGLFPVNRVLLSVPDRDIVDAQVVSDIAYFENRRENTRAGLNRTSGGRPISVGFTTTGDSPLGDADVIDVIPSFIGTENLSDWRGLSVQVPGAIFSTPLSNIARFGKASIGFDTDFDTFPDSSDSCTFTPDSDQVDADADGIGNVCDADLNNDCVVNVQDLGLLRASFFSSDPVADFNSDGAVNVVDLGIMRTLFFLPPGPTDRVTDCDLREALAAYYPLDFGLLTDASGMGNDGAAANVIPVSGVSGEPETAVRFQPQAGTVISVPHSPTLQPEPGEEFSVNIWFRTLDDATQRAGDPSLISKTQIGFLNGWDIRMDGFPEGGEPGNSLQYALSDIEDNMYVFKTDFPVNDGEWHMATMVVSEEKLTAYFDGIEVGEQVFTTWLGITTQDVLEIGSFNEFSDRHFDGDLDEIRIYNRALTQLEISFLYRSLAITR